MQIECVGQRGSSVNKLASEMYEYERAKEATRYSIQCHGHFTMTIHTNYTAAAMQ